MTMTTPIACPVWLLGVLASLPVAMGIALGITIRRLTRRLDHMERDLATLRRRGEERTAPIVHAPSVTVPRGPRVAAVAAPMPEMEMPEPEPPMLEAVPARPAPPTLIAVPDLADEPLESDEAPGALDAEIEAFEERFSDVLSLAASGMSTAEVARACGLPAGQVELIVGLGRRVRGRADASARPS